ncbi:MAG: molybdopterin-guanine dinucleotide biosynthesis protein B [Acidimicrobiia bacterium]|nr:molybdopterin-guanine dinucleotide biosynthesis protein B [Acidimicrobiia bacterium]
MSNGQSDIFPLFGGYGETSPAVVAIVGRSGSGKTTLIEALVPNLAHRGFRVGVIKHHHRSSAFDLADKDTDRFSRSGAEVVVGMSPVQVAVFRAPSRSPDIDAVVCAHMADADLVLIEGGRSSTYPKIEVHRADNSNDLLCDPTELSAIVSDASWSVSVPVLDPTAVSAIAGFIAGLACTHPTASAAH